MGIMGCIARFWEQTLQGRASQNDEETIVFTREFVGQEPTDTRPMTFMAHRHISSVVCGVPHILYVFAESVAETRSMERSTSCTALLQRPPKALHLGLSPYFARVPSSLLALCHVSWSLSFPLLYVPINRHA